jgi:hypothetical protein
MAQSGKATLSVWLSAPPIKVGDHAFLPTKFRESIRSLVKAQSASSETFVSDSAVVHSTTVF